MDKEITDADLMPKNRKFYHMSAYTAVKEPEIVK